MPRINIEDSYFIDPRRSRLIALLSNADMADGLMLRAFKLAQKYWCNKDNPKQLVPEKAFFGEKLDILIETNWAEKRDNGFYIHGVEANFNWWFEKVKAGRKGGLAKRSSAKAVLSTSKQNVASSSSSSSFSKELIHTCAFDNAPLFNTMWQEYPVRKGKKAALRHFKATVKNQQDFDNIKKALQNYKNSKSVKGGFIQYGSTWFNQWQDWIECDERKQIIEF